jgi:flagellar hook-length control protein FliK
MIAVTQNNVLDGAAESALQIVSEEEFSSNGILQLSPLKPNKLKTEVNLLTDQDADIKKESDSTAPNITLLQAAVVLLPPTPNVRPTQSVDANISLSTATAANPVARTNIYDLLKTSALADKNANVDEAIPISGIASNNAILVQPFERTNPQLLAKTTSMTRPAVENDAALVNNKPAVVIEGNELFGLAVAAQAALPRLEPQVAISNTVSASPGKPGWDQAISQKIVWMIGASEQSVTLTLNPPDMGPLQVVLHVRNAQAEATFTSDNALVRQALADGMDNLRDNMQQAGIQLGQANIHAGHQSQAGFQQLPNNQRLEVVSEPVVISQSELLTSKATLISSANGLVDTFA